jgi:hypothetical protein
MDLRSGSIARDWGLATFVASVIMVSPFGLGIENGVRSWLASTKLASRLASSPESSKDRPGSSPAAWRGTADPGRGGSLGTEYRQHDGAMAVRVSQQDLEAE